MSEDEPKKKRSYHWGPEQRAKQAANGFARTAKKRVEAADKELAKARDKASKLKRKARDKAEAANDIADKISGKSSPKKGNVITGEEVEAAGKAIRRAVAEHEEIIFKPNAGPQTVFLSSSETEVLYGGAAGGGKSYAMLVDPLRFMHRPAHRALLIRRSMPELMELIDLSKEIYPKAFPGCVWHGGQNRWTFPSGATLLFGYCDADADVRRYIGQSYSWIGVDELTHFATSYVWDMLRSRLRTTDPMITPYMRATTNPGGIGGWWVKKTFVDPAPWGEAFWGRDMDTNEILRFPDIELVPEYLRGTPAIRRRFIPAKLTDNPYLMESPEYMANLSAMPEAQRRRLLEGDWDVAEDSAFPEFHRGTHVVPAFIPPNDWPRFRACDYGFVAPAAVIWLTVDYSGTVYAYRELYAKGLDAERLAEAILEIEEREPFPITGPLDNESWARRGQIGPSIAEVMMRMGVRWLRADKGPGSRINGKLEVHRRLAIDPVTEQPGLLISENCKNLARTLPMLPLDPNKPEDVDTKFKEDHLYDALRYGLSSRLIRHAKFNEEILYDRSADNHMVADSTFGY
jgi:hypothetical protein